MKSRPGWKPEDSEEHEANSAREVGFGFRLGRGKETGEVLARVKRIISFRGFGIPEVDRQDIEQEVMRQLWEAIHRPSFDLHAGFWGFVDSVAARRCVDWYRRSRLEIEVPLDLLADGSPEPLTQTLSRERIRVANEVLATLDRPCRELLELRITRGLDFAEIGRRLSKNPGALRVQLYRCVRRMQDRIRELQGGVGERSVRDQP